jgi:hypothetical protein
VVTVALDPDKVLPWPLGLDDLKDDLDVADDDTRNDATLTRQLAAAIDFVADFHAGRYEFGEGAFAGVSTLPLPPQQMRLGIIRLAGRWFNRRRSPDGVITMGDLGTQNIPGFDTDLERQLEMGRQQRSWVV